MLEFLDAFYDIHCGHVFRQEDIDSIPIVKELNDLLMNWNSLSKINLFFYDMQYECKPMY